MKEEKKFAQALLAFSVLVQLLSCGKKQMPSTYPTKTRGEAQVQVKMIVEKEETLPGYILIFNKAVKSLTSDTSEKSRRVAIELLTQTTKEKEDFWQAYYNLAYISYTQKKYREAQKYIDKIVQDQRNKDIDLLEASISLKNGKDNLAFAQSTITYNRYDNPSFALAMMGTILMDYSYCKEAIGYFNKVNKVSKELYEVLVNKGTCLMKLKRFKDAVVAFETVYNFNIKEAYLLGQYAYSLLKIGRIELAKTIYLELINKYPDNAAAYKNTGILFELYLRNPLQAASFYDRYLKFDKKDKEKVANWRRIALEKAAANK